MLELIVGSLYLQNVDSLLLVHLSKPLVHNFLLALHHAAQGVEEVPGPHNLGVHDHLVDEVVGLGHQLGALHLLLVMGGHFLPVPLPQVQMSIQLFVFAKIL